MFKIIVIGGAVIVQLFVTFNFAYATCQDGTKASCRIDGKAGTKTCENGEWGLCEADEGACPQGRLGDAKNCGRCGNRCPGNQSCQGSVCSCGGRTACTGPTDCRNLFSDPLNCGRCDFKCSSGQVCHAGTCATATGTEPLDLFWKTTDLNGLPLNPDWIARSNPNMVKSKHVELQSACSICGSSNDCDTSISDIKCWRKCTSFPITEDIAFPCKFKCNHGGHLNWLPATYTGSVFFKDYSAAGITGTVEFQDDDANFTLKPDDDAGLAGRDDVIHSEMSSIETINRFESGWWLAFHNAVHESAEAARALIPGNRAIMIGLVGFDMQHNIHVELHPIYAMAIEIDGNPSNNRWAIFARNWGNEGACGTDPHPLPSRAIVFSLPGPVGTTPTGVTETAHQFRGNGTAVTEPFFTDRSAAIVFQLGDPGDETQINGEITLKWTLPAGVAVAKPAPPQRPVLSAAASEKDELPGLELLTPTQRQQLKATLPAAPTRDKGPDKLVPKRVPFKMPAKLATAQITRDVTTTPNVAKEKRDLQTLQTLCAMLRDNPKRPKFCSTLPPGPTR
jgi:hypothetical protein